MNYFVKRGDKEYGPYTLATLQQYVAQGNISRQDLGRSEAMADWMPVGDIIGTIPAAPASGFGAPVPARPVSVESLPPSGHWVFVVVLGIVTFGLFWIIWLLVQASWIRRVRPESKAILYLLGYAVCLAGIVVLGSKNPITVFVQLGGLVAYLIGIFQMRSDIEEYYGSLNPAGISLSGGMTFFFNAAYFQYHFREIRQYMQNSRGTAVAAATLG